MKIMISPSVSKVNGPSFLISSRSNNSGLLALLGIPAFQEGYLLLQLSRFFNENCCVLHQLDGGLAQGFGFTTNLFGCCLVWHGNHHATDSRAREALWKTKLTRPLFGPLSLIMEHEV
jgi:hypothetical protein